MSRIFPDLSDDLLLNLFHKGAKIQWTADDLDWDAKVTMPEPKRMALAHLLTPIYLGEQSAMVGASNILPRLLGAGETTAALYLSSFIMDEARHFEALTRLYRQLGQEPLSVRRNPVFLRYHHRIQRGDRADWVWGILFSDVIAKHFYRAFGVAQSDPLFGEMSKQILVDESRHLAFADNYLRRNVARMDPARVQGLVDMRDDLYRILESMAERLMADAAVFEIDGNDWVNAVMLDVEKFGRRIGIVKEDSEPPSSPPPPEREVEPPRPSRSATVISLSSSVKDTVTKCFGCLIAALCGKAMVKA